jgi:hypothetical protein
MMKSISIFYNRVIKFVLNCIVLYCIVLYPILSYPWKNWKMFSYLLIFENSMTCSTCKQIGHKKTTCGLTIKCKLCNKSGHPASKCTYNIIYKYLKQLPKALIDIIFDYKTSTEIFDCSKMYFNCHISSRINVKIYRNRNSSSRITNSIRKFYLKKTVIKSLNEKVLYIKTKLDIVEKIPCKIERSLKRKVCLSELFNFIHDKQWLIYKHPFLLNKIRLKLLQYYTCINWSNASLYHNLVFGTFLDK